MRGNRFLRRSAACVGLIALAGLLRAAEPAPAPRSAGTAAALAPLGRETYLLPPKEIADAVLASRGEIVALTNLSPDGRKFLIAKRDPLPPVERLGAPCVHLAEMAFDPVACRSRELWVGSAEALDLFFPAERRTVPVRVPSGARIASPAWSPDGSKLAFFALFPDATHICVADTETGACRKVTQTPVLATLVTAFQWSPDGKRIHTVLLPDGGKRPVPKPGIATEPKVRIARDGKDPSRTYRYLLESPYQMQLLEHLLTGQVAVVGVEDGAVTPIGEPAMVRSVSASPNEKQFRVATVKKPFSYYAPFQRFGTQESIWDKSGKSLVTLSDRNLRETETPPVVTPATTPTQPPFPKGGLTKGARGTGGTQPVPDPTQPAPTPPVNPTNPDDAPTVAPEPFDPDAKRDLSWRPDGKGMSFLQLEPVAKDAKKDDAKKDDTKAVRKDRVMQWLPPFGKDDAKVVYESPNRIVGAQYSADGHWLFISQTVDAQRQITAIDVANPKTTYVISRGGSDFATPKKDEPPAKKDGGDSDNEDADDEQPGAGRGGATVGLGLLARPLGAVNVVRVSNTGTVYLSGTERARGAGEGAFPKPYIDAVNIKTGKKTRVFEGKADVLETVDGVDGDDVKYVFTTRQKSNVVPNSYVTDVGTGKATKLTDNVEKSAWFHELKTERFRATRADGIKFWVKVTRSPKAEGKLPALFWIYPREYADQADYDAKAGRGGTGTGPGATAGRYTGPAPRSVAILTLAGYAVVEPDVPIVGPTGRMNDNYVPDLRNGLWAAIDECDKRGLIDRDRLACGGHSYGAFSTANALAHTPFFKAGIAGDGCYNRTLTSMSFQSERRQLWDARETYLEMSPLLRANQINGALLMYHGMEDANVGTHPMNSEALFAALDGLGKPAALYMYPYEGHGPIARETNLDMWARWLAWLDLYVKSAKAK
ncbi:S9 family peptidase [Gemmata sp. G18]|uniref:S9 family peptidase n=1 Tax=Gemmata palustris TaxID=2822762 RepID=A0ABS5BTN6_9BACT|nr:prolyl oligopeptidase family serine peptidase [Gemmata palustris]MBP3957085.1 S9 family peptidase [Gemmata palustris]